MEALPTWKATSKMCCRQQDKTESVAGGEGRFLSDLNVGFSLREIKSNVQGGPAGLPWANEPVSKQQGQPLLCSIIGGIFI